MKYDLVFEGGGAKGMVLVGACDELFKRGHSFDRLLGTSAGAITATLMAAGYTADELLAALDEKENGQPVFAGFMGDPMPFSKDEIDSSAIRDLLRNINLKFIPDFLENRLDDHLANVLADNRRFRHIFALVERGGWYAADKFVSWLQNKLDSGPWKNGQRNFSAMTLAQFHDETQVDLSVVASDTTDGKILVLNHHTAPQCPAVWAVRMSMSIPLVWDEVIWHYDWGHYLKRDISGHVIVDGGLLSNFPIELFISDHPHITRLMGKKSDNPVLGLLIDEKLPVPQPAAKGIFTDVDVKFSELRTVQRISRLIETATKAHDKMVMDEYSHLVVRLPANGYGTTEFDMDDLRRDALVNSGRDAMIHYFDKTPLPTGAKSIEAGGKASTADRIAGSLLE